MRDLTELGLHNGAGQPVERDPPTDEQVRAFEAHFGVRLPEAYLQLLRVANGGRPLLDAYVPVGLEEPEYFGINRFHFLNDDREAVGGLWWNTLHRPPEAGARIIPIAGAGGGDQVALNCEFDPPLVQVWCHEYDFELIDVADSFEEFIDLLERNPDLDYED